MTRKLKPDFPETFVGHAIQAFISRANLSTPNVFVETFTGSRERILGVDGLIGRNIVGVKPFWMQFKRVRPVKDVVALAPGVWFP